MINTLLLIAAVTTSVSLDGIWSAKYWKTPPRGSVREISAIPGEAKTIAGTVPGCVELDLEAAKLIPNLLVSTNVFAMREWEDCQWLYTRKFSAPAVAPDERAVLRFDGLDTLADIFVNGKKVGEAGNFFLPHEFDITDAMKPGAENEVAVLFRSVVMESHKGVYGVIGNAAVSGVEMEGVRKPSSMFGWDILPRLVSCGIYSNCRVEMRTPEQIKDVFYVPLRIDADKRLAEYLVDVRLEGRFDNLNGSTVSLTLSRNGQVAKKARVKALHWSPRLQFTLNNADLWWPRGFGEPALYDACLEWKDKNGKVIAADNRKIGLRKIEFKQDDYRDKENPGEFLFIVNGKPCFIRGTNWVPVDPLPARAAKRIIPTLEYVKAINCNMVRVWGGGMYEPECFWNWCDANGVMVWQDFCYACTMFPQNNPEYLKEIRRETRDVVVRLRNHPSLALWCGNNENDSVLAIGTLRSYKPDPNNDVISRRIIPEVLFEFDPVHPYLPSSPYVSKDVIAGRTQAVEWHYYRRWWKSDLMTKSPIRFSSELGYHGISNREALEKVIPPASLYPWTSPAESNILWKTKLSEYRPEINLNSGAELHPAIPPSPGIFAWNDEWKYRSILPYHQMENDWYFPGRLDRILLQIGMLFDKVELGLDDLIEQSQFTQSEAMKFIMENYRSRKFNGRNGMCWWNIREGWPTVTECFVDYFGGTKRVFEVFKNVQRDFLAMIDEKGQVLFINDTLEAQPGSVKITDAATGRIIFTADALFTANGVAKVGKVALQGQGLALIEYSVRGKTFKNHYLYGKPPFKFAEVREWLKRGDSVEAVQSAALPTGCPDFEIEAPRANGGPIVRAADFGVSEANEHNAEAANRAFAEARRIKASKVVFEKGVYRCFDGPGLAIDGLVDCVVDFGGSTFVFRRTVPNQDDPSVLVNGEGNVEISNCIRTEVGNFNIDWDWEHDPLGVWCTLVDAVENKEDNTSYFDVELDIPHPKYPTPVAVQLLTPMAKDKKGPRMVGRHTAPIYFGTSSGTMGAKMAWLSPRKMRIWPYVRPDYGYVAPYSANRYTPQANRNLVRRLKQMEIGNAFSITHRYYGMNGVVLTSNRNFTLRNVEIWATQGLGIETRGAQKWWQLVNVNIRSKPGCNYPVTCTADAHHVVQSQGYAKMIDCEITMHRDDHFNYHDRTQIAWTNGPRELEVVNNRGIGYTMFKVGTRLRLRQQDFANVEGWKGVITAIDGEKITVDRDLPQQTGIFFVLIDDEYATENFIFKNCRFHDSSNSRGLILGNNITFDGCTFGPMNGPALRFQSCYTHNVWCEGIGCRNIVVKNCRFENVLDNFTVNGISAQIFTALRIPWKNDAPMRQVKIKNQELAKAVADYEAKGVPLKPSPDAVGNILVENCTFTNPRGYLWYIMNGSGFWFKNNEVIWNNPDAPRLPYAGLIRVDADASDVHIPEELLEKK